MRNLFNNNIKGVFLSVLALLASGCEPEANIKEYVYPAPVITEVSPLEGYEGDQVIIIGEDFGDRVEAVSVDFGGIPVENIYSCKNNMLVVQVPEGAQSGKVGVTVWTNKTNSESDFKVIPTPSIISMTSDNPSGNLFAQGGDKITVRGVNFGEDASKFKAYVNETEAVILSASNTEIILEYPSGITSGIVYLDLNGYKLEGSAFIDSSIEGDVTSLFIKNYKQPFLRSDITDGEWGTAMYWNTTSGFGSSLNFPLGNTDGFIAIQAGDGQGIKDNASLYQNTTLPSGKYKFTINVEENTKVTGRYGCVFAVANGSTLPGLDSEKDVNGVKQFTYTEEHTELLGYVQITTNTISEPVTYTLELNLTETKSVAIGFVAMFHGNNSLKISEIKIERSINQ